MTSDRVERRLSAIFAGDVAGYSRLMGADEEGTLKRLNSHRREFLDPKIAEHRGRVVKRTGDGVLIEFVSAVDAARCAVEIQRGLAERNVDVPADTRIELRIGIHVGDIIIEDGDIFGDGVNIAARLEGIAAVGGICMSDDAYRQVRGKLDATIEDGGEQELKNIARPVRVYRVRPNTKHSIATGLAQLDKPSIAVLPFANMSGGQENEYFSDGLAEEIINALAQIAGLKVIARTSAFAFKGKNEDIRRIAETLGVAHVLEGSVRKAANRIRVTAQLIAAADGSHLWSERYDRELADVFAIQDEIAQAIAAALRVKLTAKPDAQKRHTPKLPAYDAFLRGRHHLFKFTPVSWKRGTECLEQAIVLDSQFAQPHTELGLAFLNSALLGYRPMREVVHLVREEAQKALDLDPFEPGPNFLLGSVAAVYDYDWKEAGERFRTAVSSGSLATDIHWAYASFYLQPQGRFEEAVAEMEREVERDPLNAHTRAVLSSHLNHAEIYDRAIENAKKAIEIDEHHWVTYFILAETYAYTGRFAEAISAVEKTHRDIPWSSMPTGVLAGALALSGDKVRARELIQQMGDSPTPIWGRVEYHLLCSEIDEAADWYEKMIEQRDPFAVIFACAPVGRSLRQSPRWPKLARMINLEKIRQ